MPAGTLEALDQEALAALPITSRQRPAARPGFAPERLVLRMMAAIERTGLDLSGFTVLTEAASGAYAVTPVMAALAGARKVWAYTRSTRYGGIEEVTAATMSLARGADVEARVAVISDGLNEVAAEADIVTNSGHLRPLDGRLISCLPSHAVIALMYEAWEYRPGDIDLAACRTKRIPVVAVRETDPAVDVFSFLGPLAVRLLHDAGIAVYGSRIALLCDNPFDRFLLGGLQRAGATVTLYSEPSLMTEAPWDAVLVALRPRAAPVVDGTASAALAAAAPNAVVAQLWGDVDRAALMKHGLAVWPPAPPSPGHMAILLSALGPEPIVRLQAGGLRAAEIVRRGGTDVATPTSVAEVFAWDDCPGGSPAHEGLAESRAHRLWGDGRKCAENNA